MHERATSRIIQRQLPRLVGPLIGHTVPVIQMQRSDSYDRWTRAAQSADGPHHISGVSDPDGDPITITPTDVSQDEPGAPGDATLAPLTVRADRDGASDGRVYTITFMASDGRGGTCTGAVKVCVPHDQGFDVPCVDQGPRYRSLP